MVKYLTIRMWWDNKALRKLQCHLQTTFNQRKFCKLRKKKQSQNKLYYDTKHHIVSLNLSYQIDVIVIPQKVDLLCVGFKAQENTAIEIPVDCNYSNQCYANSFG